MGIPRSMIPKVKSKSWTLLDGVKQNAEFPDTFEIPDKADREGLKVGDLCKVAFIPDEPGFVPTAERMWVEVTHVFTGRYIGTLRNAPIVIDAKFGNPVEFAPDNVICVQ